jgi:hypothetical protein
MRVRCIAVIESILLIIAGCSSRPIVSPTTEAMPTSTALATSVPTETPSIVGSPTLPVGTIAPTKAQTTKTPQPITTPTQRLPLELVTRCSTQSATNSMPLWTSGSLLFTWFGTQNSGINDQIWSLSAESLQPSLVLQDVPGAFVHLSNDGVWLAWERLDSQSNGRQLVLHNLVQKTQIQVPWSPSWTQTANWAWTQDNKVRVQTISQPRSGGGTEIDTVVLDPSTTKTERRTLVVPMLPYLYAGTGTAFSTFTSFDPTGTLVIYPVQREQIGIVLRDLTHGKDLWAMYGQDGSGYFTGAIWLPDGRAAAIALLTATKDVEIFLVDRDGQTRQLTQLSKTFAGYSVRYPTWSSDGRYLAFWLEDTYPPSPPGLNRHLFILDTSQAVVINTCIDAQSSNAGGYGMWIPGTSLLMLSADVSHQRALLVMDAASNRMQTVATSNPSAKSPTLVGWTSVEMVR